MNYLELCQQVAIEMGVTSPTTVVNQTGDARRIVGWVSQAWIDIQNEQPQWDFLWRRVEFDTQATVAEYDPSGNKVNEWDADSFTIFKKSDGEGTERRLPVATMSEHLATDIGVRANGAPEKLVVLPSMNLRLVPAPDSEYTLQCNYWRMPTELVNDTDIPALDAHYHSMIVAKALMAYYLYEQDVTMYQGSEARYIKALNQLTGLSMPQLNFETAPLA